MRAIRRVGEGEGVGGPRSHEKRCECDRVGGGCWLKKTMGGFG